MSIGWFVDGQFVYKCWREVCPDPQDGLDYVKLRNFIESELNDDIDESYFLTAEPQEANQKQNDFHKFISHLPPTGPGLRPKVYWVQKKELYWPSHMGGGLVVHPDTNEKFILTQQKAVDVGMAFHLTRSHSHRGWGKLALCAGDADFYEVAEYLTETKNVDIYLFGLLKNIADDLRRYARKVYSFDDIKNEILRESR